MSCDGAILPEDEEERIKANDAILLGAVGDPRIKAGILERGLLGTVAGPHPFPAMVRDFQKIIGEEAKQQLQDWYGRRHSGAFGGLPACA